MDVFCSLQQNFLLQLQNRKTTKNKKNPTKCVITGRTTVSRIMDVRLPQRVLWEVWANSLRGHTHSPTQRYKRLDGQTVRWMGLLGPTSLGRAGATASVWLTCQIPSENTWDAAAAAQIGLLDKHCQPLSCHRCGGVTYLLIINVRL